MAILNFPDTTGQPTDGSFTYTENGVTYSWDGTKWIANTTTTNDNTYLRLDAANSPVTGDIQFDASVGVGISPESRLHVIGQRDASTGAVGATLFDANFRSGNAAIGTGQAGNLPCIQGYGTGTSFHMLLNPREGNVGIGTTSYPSDKLVVNGNLRFSAAGQGINFNNYGAGANSNLLDDYEEGTWTAYVTSTGNPNGSLASSTGSYTKIGRLVRVATRISGNNVNISGHSGDMIIRGFPFLGSSGADVVATPIAYNGVYGRFLMAYDFPTSFTYVNVCNSAIFSDRTPLVPSGSNFRYYFSFVYQIAE